MDVFFFHRSSEYGEKQSRSAGKLEDILEGGGVVTVVDVVPVQGVTRMQGRKKNDVCQFRDLPVFGWQNTEVLSQNKTPSMIKKSAHKSRQLHHHEQSIALFMAIYSIYN